MSSINRREFFRVAATATAAAGFSGGAIRAQDSASRGAADPLRDPTSVGSTRRVVDPSQNDPVVVGIERRLGCTCPCGLDVFTCRTTDFSCSYSPALHDEVVALLAEGRDADSVIAAFVAKYGESVLMAPKPQGFGVLGYLLPGAVIVTVGGLLAAVLIGRGRRVAPVPATPAPGIRPAPEPAAGTSGTPDQMAELERALRDLET